jgi:hypothetical protein
MKTAPTACTAVIDSPSSSHEHANPNAGTRNIIDEETAGPTRRTAW